MFAGICSVQASLFNEPEAEVDEPIEAAVGEAVEDSSAASRPKTKPKRKPLPKDLPRETRIIDIADEEKVCPCCNGELHQFGEETSEQLEYIPATVKVIETVRPKYACRTCEQNNTLTPIKIADVPASPIPTKVLQHPVCSRKSSFKNTSSRYRCIVKKHFLSSSTSN